MQLLDEKSLFLVRKELTLNNDANIFILQA